MPEAPNNRFRPAAVMTASKHLAVPIGGSFAAALHVAYGSCPAPAIDLT